MKLQYFELDKPYVENQQRIEELMDSAALTREARVEDAIDRIGKISEERSYMNQMYDIYGRGDVKQL